MPDSQKTPKIFILDDDENSNYLNTLIMNSIGISDIDIRTSAYDAFEYLDECRNNNNFPALMFIDIELPGMKGFDFLKEYETNYQDYCPDSKIIMLTNSVSDNDRRKALKHKSVLDFWSKPLTIYKIKEVLGERFT